jgi:hypothetical protein
MEWGFFVYERGGSWSYAGLGATFGQESWDICPVVYHYRYDINIYSLHPKKPDV